MRPISFTLAIRECRNRLAGFSTLAHARAYWSPNSCVDPRLYPNLRFARSITPSTPFASNHRERSVPLFHYVLFGVHMFIMLREAVSDREPRCFVLDKNVSARTDFRIINERA